MRGTVAKRIRREVYGDFSIKEPRKYGITKKGMIVVSGLRRAYIDAKRDYVDNKKQK